jgi:hypothetical protein
MGEKGQNSIIWIAYTLRARGPEHFEQQAAARAILTARESEIEPGVRPAYEAGKAKAKATEQEDE